jgi:two-component system LytT family sensor kinase
MLVGVSFSLNDYLFRDELAAYYADKPSLPSMVFWDVAYWSAWALPSLLIYRIARRFPLGRDLPAWNLFVNVGAGLLFIILQRAIYLLITSAVNVKSPFDGMLEFLLYNLPTGFMCYGVLLLVSHVYADSRTKRREAELTAELTQARLTALQMQLRPHFLSNTLNSISSQLREDPGAANDMLSRLGRFLSLTLEQSGARVVTLEEELHYLRCYLDIEMVRRRDRLQVHYDVEAQTLGARVPSLILQPVVENAIIHGVDQSFGRVEVVVHARREGDSLRLHIRDNGEQEPDGGGYAEGFGIRITRERLNTAYGPRGGFELTRTPDGWTVADFRLPFAAAPEPAEVLG